MKNDTHILAHLGEIHSPFLHAKGELATHVLIKYLDPQQEEDILEIGFGTGATLVLLSSRFRRTRFYGVEHSEVMCQKAMRRLRFAQLGHKVNLQVAAEPLVLPFEACKFDKVFLESVLAILEGKAIESMLLEIKRVLKPSGRLIMNETVWLETTTQEEIRHINNLCKKAFGIIQSSELIPYIDQWLELLARLGFRIEQVEKIDQLVLKEKGRRHTHLLSFLYTLIGKAKSKVIPSLRKRDKEFKNRSSLIIPSQRQLMEGFLIKCCKTEG